MNNHINVSHYQFLIFMCMILPRTVTKENKAKVIGQSRPIEDINYTLSGDYALCRHCGTDLAAASGIYHVRAPLAVSRQNQTLFGLDQVQVQTLVNPHKVKFDIITVLDSTCLPKGKWTAEHSWFPGYAWKPCLCSRCKQHLGWAFERIELSELQQISPSFRSFYALILDNIISELYSNQLLIGPQTLTVR